MINIKRYLYIAVPGTDIEVQVKLDVEGVVVDLLKIMKDDVEIIDSTYKFYHELGIKNIEFTED